MASTYMNIGGHIAALRKARGLTQEQLAAQLGSRPRPSASGRPTAPALTSPCSARWRALGTNVDTLLQFEENLSDQEVAARINEVAEAAMAGDTGAEERLEAMLHRWPGCTALLFNAAAVYDGFELFFPAADEETRRRWKTRKRALLEEIRRTGTAAYWQAATIQLASLAAAEGDTGQAEALLQELPAYTGDPTAVRVQLCLKKGQPEQALKLAQTELYKSVVKIESCISTLLNPQVQPDPQKGAQSLPGLPGRGKRLRPGGSERRLSGGDLPAHRGNRPGRRQLCPLCGSADRAARPAGRGPVLPGLAYTSPDVQQAMPQPMRRMLLQSITGEEKYRPLLADPVAAAALDKLKASV